MKLDPDNVLDVVAVSMNHDDDDDDVDIDLAQVSHMSEETCSYQYHRNDTQLLVEGRDH